ncbi:hypothetical protein QTP88_000930 [Uroleucon formosanum]
MPPINYEFLFCVVTKNGKQTKKYAQRSYLNKFHWLVLSHKDQGLYCKYCALFASVSGGGVQTNTPLKRLVKQPLKAFDDLLGEKGSLLTHQRNKYHQMSVEAGKSFLVTYHNPDLNVANQVCKQRMAQVKENRDRLRPIVSTIVLCGRQNIPLRGHRDDGKIILNVDKNEQNSVVANQEGNFRAFLRFCIESGDSNLRQHLEVANSNATYISKTVQNELIDTRKDLIQEAILARVKEAKLFSLIFDETTDISHTEQLSLSIRYFYNGVIKEDFLPFCDAYEMIHFENARVERRLTGVELSRIVEDLCFKFDIDLAWCVGIGTDSCSVMASETKDAVHELSKKATNAKRCPCNNHILNNSLAKSSKVSACRNDSATMRKVVAFANASAKRHKVFEEELEGMALQGICETRWIERHDGHLQFQGDNLVKICNALHRITTWEDSKTASDAQCLRHVLCSSEFIIASVCLNDVLGTTVSLSRFLQTSSIDLKRATEAMKDTIFLLKQKRTNSDVVFQQLFSEQKHRENNQPGQTAEEYFRKSIYIPLLDSIIADLEKRLSPEVLSLFNLGVFLPKTVYSEVDLVVVREAVKNYTELLHRPHISTVLSEFQLWVTKWKREVESGNKVPEFLPQCMFKRFRSKYIPIISMASKRKHLTLTEKIKLLDFYQKENVSARTLADKFGIGRTQATDLIKNRETILKLWKSHARAKNIPISGPILKEKALQVSKEFECENFKASNGWLDKFKSRYNISFKVVCGESKSVDTETVDEWRIKVKQLISSYEPRNIYNADET